MAQVAGSCRQGSDVDQELNRGESWLVKHDFVERLLPHLPYLIKYNPKRPCKRRMGRAYLAGM